LPNSIVFENTIEFGNAKNGKAGESNVFDRRKAPLESDFNS